MVPPFVPAQVQAKALVPLLTTEAAPVVQRLVVGAALTAVPLAAPQAPACAAGGAAGGALIKIVSL